MRIAFVGAYGNGKTTLTTELAARLGLPRVHGTAMRDPAGGAPKALEETTEPELIQLAVRRFTERSVDEARHQAGFLSDGSVLHEWVYTKVRLSVGRHPEPPASLGGSAASPRAEVCAEVVDQLSLLAQKHMRLGYDLIVHCPVEVPLPDGHSPVSEYFRVLSDRLMLDTLDALTLPVHVVKGSVKERIEQVLAMPDVRTAFAGS
jgi:hypothetical protein